MAMVVLIWPCKLQIQKQSWCVGGKYQEGSCTMLFCSKYMSWVPQVCKLRSSLSARLLYRMSPASRKGEGTCPACPRYLMSPNVLSQVRRWLVTRFGRQPTWEELELERDPDSSHLVPPWATLCHTQNVNQQLDAATKNARISG